MRGLTVQKYANKLIDELAAGQNGPKINTRLDDFLNAYYAQDAIPRFRTHR
jgi:hypothetical protein